MLSLAKGCSESDLEEIVREARKYGMKGKDVGRLHKRVKQLEAQLGRLDVRLEAQREQNALLQRGRGAQEHGGRDHILPAYTYPAIHFLEQLDFTQKDVFEIGAGAGTHFWSERARAVTAADASECLRTLGGDGRVYDVICFSGEYGEERTALALDHLSETGMILLNEADWFPGTASKLRAAGLLQVDFLGTGPGRAEGLPWSTSLFFRRQAQFPPRRTRQPYPLPGSVMQILDATASATLDKPGLDGLDDKLARHLNFRGGFFIEAGASDGYAQSNTFHLEQTLGWKGILVEPLAEAAEQARRNRAGSRVFNCALVADENATPVVQLHGCGLMSVVDDRFEEDEDLEEHLRSGRVVQSLTESPLLEVPARTLTSILDECPPERGIDFLSLDVEGYELEVLRGLDLKRYAPRMLLVETAGLDAVTEALQPHGYRMVGQLTYHDYLFQLHEAR